MFIIFYHWEMMVDGEISQFQPVPAISLDVLLYHSIFGPHIPPLSHLSIGQVTVPTLKFQMQQFHCTTSHKNAKHHGVRSKIGMIWKWWWCEVVMILNESGWWDVDTWKAINNSSFSAKCSLMRSYILLERPQEERLNYVTMWAMSINKL